MGDEKKQGFLSRVLHGGPKHQERKKAEAELKEKARKAELEAYGKGLIAGAKAKGKREGFEKGSSRGGVLGAVDKIGKGMSMFEKAAGPLVSDVDISGLGQFSDTTAFGLGGGTKTRRHRPKTHKRTRKR